MDFPAVTVCNRNRVHCGHLKQMIAANLSETRNLSIAEAYLLLEKGEYSEEDNFAEMFSLLEDTGCRNDFDKFNDTVLPEGSFRDAPQIKKRENVGIFPKWGTPPPPCLGMIRLFEEKNHVFFCILGGVSHVKNSKKMEVEFG